MNHTASRLKTSFFFLFTSPSNVELTLCFPSLQLFSIVVFASITAEGYINPTTQQETKCMFNQNDSACSYGVGIGVLAFLACVIFLILDAFFPQISNAKERKYIVIGDLVFSGESQTSLSSAHTRKEKKNPPKQEV